MSHPATALSADGTIPDGGRLALATRLHLVVVTMASASIVVIEPSPYDILIMGLIVAFFALGMRAPRGLARPAACFALFLVSTAVAAALAPDPEFTARILGIKLYLVASWVFFAALVHENPERVMPVLWLGWTIAALIAIGLGLAGYYGLVAGSDVLMMAGRVRGLFKDPNVFGPFIVPVALYVFARLDTGGFVLKAGLVMVLLFGVLLSFSRGAWLNAAVSFAVFALLRFLTYRSADRLLRMSLVSTVVGLAGAGAFFYAISTPEIAEMFEERAHVVQYYDVAEGGRFATQLQTLSAILVDPIGVGPGRSADVFGLEPHNHFLHILVESGWVAGIAYFVFVALTLAIGLRAAFVPSPVQTHLLVVLAATIGVLTQSLFIDSHHWRHFYVLYGMLWGLSLWTRAAARQAAA